MTLRLKFCTCEFIIFMAFINIIREIINHKWLPKWPIIQWFSESHWLLWKKVDLAIQGQVTLLYLNNVPVDVSCYRLRGFHKHRQVQHFHCNLQPAQFLKTIVFQRDDAPQNSTVSLVASSAGSNTESSSLHSACFNRHKARPDRSSTHQRVPAHYLLLKFLGKGIVIISGFFFILKHKLNNVHPFLHLAVGYGYLVDWSVKSLVWQKEQVVGGNGWVFRVLLFSQKLSKKYAGWKWLGTSPHFRTKPV